MSKKIVTVLLVLAALFGALTYCHTASAGETVTAGDILTTDKVMSNSDLIKNVAGGIGMTIGGFGAYSAAAAAGLTGTGLVVPTIAGAIGGGLYLYGAASMGERLGIHFAAKNIRKDLREAMAAVASARATVEAKIDAAQKGWDSTKGPAKK